MQDHKKHKQHKIHDCIVSKMVNILNSEHYIIDSQRLEHREEKLEFYGKTRIL